MLSLLFRIVVFPNKVEKDKTKSEPVLLGWMAIRPSLQQGSSLLTGSFVSCMGALGGGAGSVWVHNPFPLS